MEPIRKFFGRVVSGERKYYKPTEHRAYIASLENQEFEELLQPKHIPVTEDQYGYYFAGIIGTCMQTEVFGGWTKEEIDAYFKVRFLSYSKAVEYGEFYEELRITPGKSRLSKKKMSQFIEDVKNFLAELDIFPPPPEEFFTAKFATVKSKGNDTTKEQMPDKV